MFELYDIYDIIYVWIFILMNQNNSEIISLYLCEWVTYYLLFCWWFTCLNVNLSDLNFKSKIDSNTKFIDVCDQSLKIKTYLFNSWNLKIFIWKNELVLLN
jgi:hypothetical protein